MTNPLNTSTQHDGGRRPLRPGESFTFARKTKDGDANGVLTIDRTSRDYALDLCEAYNGSMRPDAPPGAKYYVDEQFTVKLAFPRHDEAADERGISIARTEWNRVVENAHRIRGPQFSDDDVDQILNNMLRSSRAEFERAFESDPARAARVHNRLINHLSRFGLMRQDDRGAWRVMALD